MAALRCSPIEVCGDLCTGASRFMHMRNEEAGRVRAERFGMWRLDGGRWLVLPILAFMLPIRVIESICDFGLLN